MKSCNEMVNSLLERREQYETAQRNKRKLLTRTLTPICCCGMVALLGLGAWQGGMFSKAPIQSAEDAVIPGTKDWYEPGESAIQADDSSQTQFSNNTNHESQSQTDIPNQIHLPNVKGDVIGMIIYNHREYVQNFELSVDDYELCEKIGNSEDFEGTFNPEWCKKTWGDRYGIIDEAITGAEVYTVKNNPDLLVAKFENFVSIILKATPHN